MLILIAKFRAKPGCREQMVALAENVIGPSRGEEGCITYEFLQDPFSPDSFTFYEKWRSMEDLTLHGKEPHFITFDENVRGLIEGSPSVVAYEVASETEIS